MTTFAAPPTFPPTYACENCGQPFTLGTLACPRCGAFVYRRRLEELSAEALRLEAINPMSAAMLWRQCLDLLPPGSPHYAEIAHRVGMLSSGLVPQFPPAPAAAAAAAAAEATAAEARPAERPPDPWPVAVGKTAGSMLLSILFYMLLWPGNGVERLIFAAGFAGLILVHELGHVIAMRYYKLSASPPIFIPFLGAVINMRQQPRNAWVEAVVGIGGPALGTVAALVAVGLFLGLGLEPETSAYELALTLAYYGVVVNLFNLLPFPPLDGGRITAALSPWMWILGVVGLGILLFVKVIPLFLAALLIFAGLPRIVHTLWDRRARDNPYYRISSQRSATMTILYLSLSTLLTVLIWWLPTPAIIEMSR
jgi:Zn-dependent protease